MKPKKSPTSESRRKFLRDTALTGGAAAASVVAPGVVMAVPDEPPADAKAADEGYRLTQHILDYYKSAAS